MKQWFADSPAAALRFYAGPAAASVPANARLQLLRQEQVARILGRGHRIADVVLLAETASGLRQAFFIFEESAQPARAAVYQLLEYTVRFGQWLERNTGPFELTPVLDVLGEGSLDGRVELNGATRRTLQFECEVRRIAHMDPVEALGSRDPVAITNVMNMHVAPERRVALCAEAIVLLDELLPREHFRKYGEYVLACARLSAEQRVELDERLRESKMQVETLFTDYEKRGQLEARRADLLTVLAERGLRVTAVQRKLIASCESPSLLKLWHKAAITAGTAREVFSIQGE